jgi:protein-S-isoprenylcysteine O-methyltransferase Ste14
MTSETPFRIALLIIVVLTTMVIVYHGRRAIASGGKVSRQAEGVLFSIGLRIGGNLLWIATLVWLLVPAAVEWATIPLPVWVRWVGVAIAAVCPILLHWTLATLGANNLTDTVAVRAEATLVTSGPYRWVRHPYYVVAALLMGSVTVLTANWLIGLSSLFVLALLALRTPKEEQMLIDRFGEPYRDYMTRTGRFCPRIGRGMTRD